MQGLLAGKTTLVTGAAGGIGREAALLFAKEGASVVVADINGDGARETTEMVKSEGGKAVWFAGDISLEQDVKSMLKTATNAFGKLDCAFNNAAITAYHVNQYGKYTADWKEDAFDRIINVNLKGTWHCMRAEITQMLAQGGGAIVNTGSLASIEGFRGSSAYVASKHGVAGLTKSAALEYAPKIRINALCPGFVNTAMSAVAIETRNDEVLARIPLNRWAQPIEVAEMACWLLSDRASYVTGCVYAVDGGSLAG